MDWRYRSGNQQHRNGRNKGCRWHQQCLQDCVVSLVCSPTLWNDNFTLSPPSSKLLLFLFSQYTNIHHHHHHHHHQLRPRSQSLLLNPAHYSPSSFFIHSSFISSIPSSPIHAQAFPIFRTIFFDPSTPLSVILSFPSSLLNFSQELSLLTASIFFFFLLPTHFSIWAALVAYMVKNPPASAGDLGSVPGSRRSPGEGNGNPLQHSCLESPMGRGDWRAIVHGNHKESDMTERLSRHISVYLNLYPILIIHWNLLRRLAGHSCF